MAPVVAAAAEAVDAALAGATAADRGQEAVQPIETSMHTGDGRISEVKNISEKGKESSIATSVAHLINAQSG